MCAAFKIRICKIRIKSKSIRPQPESALQEHYDAAQIFQAAGNLALAALRYKTFLAEALSALATIAPKLAISPEPTRYSTKRSTTMPTMLQ